MALILEFFIAVFLAFYFCESVDGAKGKLNVGVIDYPDGRWRSLAREIAIIKDMPLEIKNMSLRQPLKLADTRKVERFIENKKISVMIGRDLDLVAMVSTEQWVPFLITEEKHLLSHIMTTKLPENVLSMFPGPNVIRQLIEDLSVYYKLKDLYVIFDDESGHTLIGYLLTKSTMNIKALEIEANTTNAEIINGLLDFRSLGRSTIMVLVKNSNIPRVLDSAMKVSLLLPNYHWIILALDSNAIDFSMWMDSGINITMFQLSHGEETGNKRMSLQDAFFADGIKVLNEVAMRETGRVGRAANETNVGLMGTFRQIKVNGMTGPIEFDAQGFRKNVIMDILGLDENGSYKKGAWVGKDKNRIQITSRSADVVYDQDKWPLGRETVNVVSILESPFLMYKNDWEKRQGNDRFEGYCVDMLEEISKIVNLKYEIYLVPDGQFGTMDENGEWDGMVKELMVGNASMSVAPLIISSMRESAVDFTKPFKACDMNVLIARPEKTSNLLQFLTPLHWQVWCLILVAVAVLSIILCLIDRLIPNDEFDPEQPRYTYAESLWFFYASLVQAGTENTPQVLSARVLSSFWWFFSLIIISSYTANMAAFLTMSQISTPITGVLSLADQSQISYGSVKASRTADFFQRSDQEIFKKMWVAMTGDNMVRSTADAIERVAEEDYAFIWDSPVNEYIAAHDCRTMSVGGPFNRQGYGIGVPMGAPYRDDLTIVLLKLNENGVLNNLDQKWWGESECSGLDSEDVAETAELAIQNVGGIFIILSCGVIISLIVCGAEFYWRKSKSTKHNKPTIEDKWQELLAKKEKETKT